MKIVELRERGSAVGESLRGVRKKDHGFGRVDVKEKVVREIQRYKDDNETNKKGFDRRFTEEEEIDTSWRDSTHEATEEELIYDRSRKKVGSQGKNSNERASISRREVSDRRSRVEEENIDDYVHEEHEDSRKLTRTPELDRYTEYKTGSNLRNVDRGESSASFVKSQSEIDKQVVQQADSRKSLLKSSNFETMSNLQRRSEEERAQNSVHVSRDRRQIDQMSVNKVEVNKQHATYIDASERANRSKTCLEIRRDPEIASSSQRRFEEEKSRKEKSSSVENLVRVRRDERTQVNHQAFNEELSDHYENQTSSSRVQVSGTQRIDNSYSSLQIRSDDQEVHSTSAVNSVNRVRGNSRGESEQNSRISEIRESNIERISNLKEVTSIRTENQKETSSSTMVQDETDYRQQTDLIGESSQSTQTRIGVSGSLHDDSSSIYQVKNDAMESASRLVESSATYVGDFVDKVRRETLASDSSEVMVEVGYNEQNIEENDGQPSSRSRMKGPPDGMWEVRAMSSQEPPKIEETKEDPSNVEVVDSKASPVITENVVARRSHRSLWAYVAEILKIGHRAGSHNSTHKSGTRSSSNESISSEAWFSGQEPNEDNDEAEKKEKARSPKEMVTSKGPTIQFLVSTSVGTKGREEIEWSEGEKGTISTSLTGIGNDCRKLKEEFGRHKVAGTGGLKKRNGLPKEPLPAGKPVEELHLAPSTSMGTMRKDPSSEGVTPVAKPEEEPSKSEKGRKFVLSSGEQASSSVTAPPSIPEIGSAQMPGIGFPRPDEITEVEKLPGDGGLKRRKLQRSTQVLTEQIDEWVEAYKRDSEHGKIDEFFMRETLLEAQKAADTWEVPVGAVLMQNGKIIARGCNLVEELRDSTAHAEMICIRQASNILRSWRLATFQILNSDDHAHFLKKQNRNPADYRPDIIHQALLAILDSPLTKAGRLQALYFRTEKGVLFEVKPYVRMPRTFKRFCGLMLQLLQNLSITTAGKREKLLNVIKNPATRHFPVNP